MPRVRLYKSELYEAASARVAPDLAAFVAGYTAWRDRAAYTIRSRHLPSGRVPLIINFDTRVRLLAPGCAEPSEHQMFMSGLHDRHTIAESSGRNFGAQIDFTALGARLFYGRPLAELANRSVPLDELFGPDADRLTQRLFEADSWEARVDVLDREVRARVLDAPPAFRVPPNVVQAWDRLTRSAGNIQIATLAGELGWSTRHLTTQFEHEFGLRPKMFARVLRFNRAVGAMSRDGAGTLAGVAADAGYFDQAHFVRDAREFAGVTPQELRNERAGIS